MSGARRPARDKEDSRTIADMQSEKTHPLGVTVVLPCLNEEGSIGQVIGAARKGIAKLGFENSEIIIVDNGSRDRSAQIAKDAGARLLHERNPGYGAALRRGFAAARYDIIVMGDSDMSYDFERLDELVRPILAGEAEFVVGNRMKSIEPGAMPLHATGNPVRASFCAPCSTTVPFTTRTAACAPSRATHIRSSGASPLAWSSQAR